MFKKSNRICILNERNPDDSKKKEKTPIQRNYSFIHV